MNIKKQFKEKWVNPKTPDVSTIKEDLEFKPKRKIAISLPTYIASLAVVVLVFSSILIVNKFSKKTITISDSSYLVDAKFSPSFGTLSYNKPSINFDISCKVYTKGKSVDTLSFVDWFNNLKLELVNDEKAYENYYDNIANTDFMNVTYGNDVYEIYFTTIDLVYIIHNDYIYCYNLKNANIKYNNFVY